MGPLADAVTRVKEARVTASRSAVTIPFAADLGAVDVMSMGFGLGVWAAGGAPGCAFVDTGFAWLLRLRRLSFVYSA